MTFSAMFYDIMPCSFMEYVAACCTELKQSLCDFIAKPGSNQGIDEEEAAQGSVIPSQKDDIEQDQAGRCRSDQDQREDDQRGHDQALRNSPGDTDEVPQRCRSGTLEELPDEYKSALEFLCGRRAESPLESSEKRRRAAARHRAVLAKLDEILESLPDDDYEDDPTIEIPAANFGRARKGKPE